MLDEGEKLLGKWTTNMVVEGHKLLGELMISDEHIYFKTKYDLSLESVASMVAYGWYDHEQVMRIPRSQVNRVTPKETMLKKKILLETEVGNLEIDNGMLPVKNIMKALESDV